MLNKLFIPKKINVGFQHRSDTYTNKLAYISYFDEKGKLRKEKSWEDWRDNSIQNMIYENTPLSGFVLNKKAGGYSSGWNYRQTYIRVYDPRGFEFEITVANLLYILENTNSIKGKGLEGEFIYGWDGKDLLLIPTASPDYKDIAEFNDLIHQNQNIKASDLKVGSSYLTKSNEKLIYMGKFNEYGYKGTLKDGKPFFFYNETYSRFETMRTVSKKFISVVEDSVSNFAYIFDKLEHDTSYSPIDRSKVDYVPYTLEEFISAVMGAPWRFTCYTPKKKKLQVFNNSKDSEGKYEYRYEYGNRDNQYDTLENIFKEAQQPMYKMMYLANGKSIREEY